MCEEGCNVCVGENFELNWVSTMNWLWLNWVSLGGVMDFCHQWVKVVNELFMNFCCFCWCYSVYVVVVVVYGGFGSLPPLKIENLRDKE